MITDFLSGEVYMPLGIRVWPDTARSHQKNPRGLPGQGSEAGAPWYAVRAPTSRDRAGYRWRQSSDLSAESSDSRTHVSAAQDHPSSFWNSAEAVAQEAYLTGRIETDFGWRMLVGDPLTRVREAGRWQEYGTKPLTLLNWKTQATGAT